MTDDVLGAAVRLDRSIAGHSGRVEPVIEGLVP
jgi:hypothetical protein